MALNGLFDGFDEPLGGIHEHLEGSGLRYEVNDAKDLKFQNFRKEAPLSSTQSTGDTLTAEREDGVYDNNKMNPPGKTDENEITSLPVAAFTQSKHDADETATSDYHNTGVASAASRGSNSDAEVENAVHDVELLKIPTDSENNLFDDAAIERSTADVNPSQNVSASADNISSVDLDDTINSDQQLPRGRNNKNKRHVQFRPASLVTGYLEPADPWKDATSYDKGSVIRLYIETNLKFRTTPLTSVIHSITLRPGEYYSHQGDLIIDYSDTNIKQVSQREVDALEPVLMKYQWSRVIIGRKLQFDAGNFKQQQEAVVSKYSAEINNPIDAGSVPQQSPATVAAAAVTGSTSTSGLADDDEIDLRVENAKFCGVTFADDATAASFIDMLEYYKSCQQLIMCYVKNLGMTCMLSASKMLRRPNTSLRALELRGSGYWIANSGGGLAGSNSMAAGDGDRNLKIFSISLRQASSTLRFLRLESCNLSGRSFFLLCAALRLNPHIRRVFLGDNQLQASDMVHMAQLLRNKLPTLCGIDVLDLRNNNIGDAGVEAIMNALIEQQVLLAAQQSLREKHVLEQKQLNNSNVEDSLLAAALAESVKTMPVIDAVSDNANTNAASSPSAAAAAAVSDVIINISEAVDADDEPVVAPELQQAKDEVSADTVEEIIEEANPAAARLDGVSAAHHKIEHQEAEEQPRADASDPSVVNDQVLPPTSDSPPTTRSSLPVETCLWRMESHEPWGSTVEPCGLRSLSLFNNNITVNSLGPIANMLLQCASIESFNLGWNPLIGGSDAAHALKEALILNGNLRHLGMQNCCLDDEGVVALAEVVASRRQFLRLDLRCNPEVKLAGYLALAHAAKQHPSLLRIDIDERVVVMPKMKSPKIAGSSNVSSITSEHSGSATPSMKQPHHQFGDTSSIASSTSDLTIGQHLKSSGSSFSLRQSANLHSPSAADDNISPAGSVADGASSGVGGGEDILMAQMLTNTLTEMFKHCNENLCKQLRLAQQRSAESSHQNSSASVDNDKPKILPTSENSIAAENDAGPPAVDTVPYTPTTVMPALASAAAPLPLKNAREIKESLLSSALFPYIALSVPQSYAASSSGAAGSATRAGGSIPSMQQRKPSLVNDLYTSGLAKFAAGMGFGSSNSPSSSSASGGSNRSSSTTAKSSSSSRNSSPNDSGAKAQPKPATKSTSRFSITKVTSSLASILLPDSVPHPPATSTAAASSPSSLSSSSSSLSLSIAESAQSARLM